MDKEKENVFETGYSEKQADLAIDKVSNDDQVKATNIFDPQQVNIKPQKKK